MYREPITILYDNSQYGEGSEDRSLSSQDDILTEAKEVEQALSRLGYTTRRLQIVYQNIETFLQELLLYRGDIVFNLCEDIKGEGVYEAYVASLMELLGVVYTGSGPLTLGLSLNKSKTQRFLSANGLPVPAHLVFETGLEALPANVQFPLIVKLLHEDGSLGMEKDSVVENETALREQVMKMMVKYHQPVIAEEYIDGREFNVAILGNGKNAQILPISEIDFSSIPPGMPRILTFASKWKEDSPEYKKTPPVCPASLSSSLEKRLHALALRASAALGCRDYVRVDFRARGETPYIIEVNPNPAISSDAGFIRSAQAAGLSYADVIGKIVECAIARKRAKSVPQEKLWQKTNRLAAS